MMRYTTGNILESDVQALVNTVNTVGVMGKGIVLQFKNAFTNNLKHTKTLVTKDRNLNSGEKVIINFPTKKERVKLTEARALLLYVLYDLVRNGEFVSEFSSEKVCYFLQKFSAEKYFKLKFEPEFYGPYSGKVRYVLNYLNGSYLTGYSDMNKKPFDPFTLVADGMIFQYGIRL